MKKITQLMILSAALVLSSASALADPACNTVAGGATKALPGDPAPLSLPASTSTGALVTPITQPAAAPVTGGGH